MKTLLIDNYDSFTYNLYDLLWKVNGKAPVVVRNDYDRATIAWEEFDNIVISPGPGHPANSRDFGICGSLIVNSDLPILGVCLGHQGIGHSFGSGVKRAPEPRHGRPSHIFHDGEGLFHGLPNPFSAVRYHSLAVEGLTADLLRTAWTDDGILMGLRHRNRPIWGIQFHPESISTDHGAAIIENFKRMSALYRGERRARSSTSPPSVASPRWSTVSDRRGLEVQTRRVDLHPNPEATYRALFDKSDNSFWLDSSRSDCGAARFSFMGDDSGPLAELVEYDLGARMIKVRVKSGPVEFIRQGIFDYLELQLQRRRCTAPADLPFEFNLGYVGYLGYELKAETGGVVAHKSSTPDASLLFVDRILAFDHRERCCYLVCLSTPQTKADSEQWFVDMASALADLSSSSESSFTKPQPAPVLDSGLKLRHVRSRYLDLIEECLSEIRAGESYEVCLTNMATAEGAIDPMATYSRLRDKSPVPFGALLRLGDITVASASPERFLSIDSSGLVESKPIKGTRPRGNEPLEDERLKQDLATCEKDRAENLMIVDLVRNDLNRVCEQGSVHVPHLFVVETFALVHQLVSTIRGRLSKDRTTVDCVRAMFPGGSMTGAPKIRTMEIIDRLESGPRGVYSGALGWFGLSGAADLSIVIRTIVAHQGQIAFGVGGAIVALSDPKDEFEETRVKARSMLVCLGQDASAWTEDHQ